jgi:hypothetical protein
MIKDDKNSFAILKVSNSTFFTRLNPLGKICQGLNIISKFLKFVVKKFIENV